MYGEPLSGPTDVERSNVENPFHQLRLERLRFLRSIPGYRHHSRTRSHVCVVRGQQPAEAVPGRRGSGNGIKRRGMGPFYTKLPRKPAISYQRDYCLRAPDRTPALQTAESALAKRYARHTPKGSVAYPWESIQLLSSRPVGPRRSPRIGTQSRSSAAQSRVRNDTRSTPPPLLPYGRLLFLPPVRLILHSSGLERTGGRIEPGPKPDPF
jgi:hypothetical protein